MNRPLTYLLVPVVVLVSALGIARLTEGPVLAQDAGELDLTTPAELAAEHPTFQSYWYQGLAELSRYELSQSRYGEVHEGEAVLIFVTEDFLTDLQVKHEFGDATNAVSVLKLNAYRRFYTGLYPYNVMTSVFTPVDGSPTLKTAHSVHEWCGMTYMQINRRDDQYEGQLHSYFQAEADAEFSFDALLEDELFTWVRRSPDTLPTGEITLLPSATWLRFRHQPAEPAVATATLTEVQGTPRDGSETAMRYSVEYQSINRELHIYFDPVFPYQIVAWEEVGASGWSGSDLTTTAVLTHAFVEDYWNLNGNDDGPYRHALGLEH